MDEDFWKQFPPIPGFDCVKMKHEIQAEIYEEIKDLSSEELVAYFNRAGERLRERGGILALDVDLSKVNEAAAPYDAKSPGKG